MILVFVLDHPNVTTVAVHAYAKVSVQVEAEQEITEQDGMVFNIT